MDLKGYDLPHNEPVTRRESRKLAIKQSILKTAEEVFLEKGFSATTIDEILERTGIARRTLYNFFPSKLALYVDMFDDYLHMLGIELSETAKIPAPPEELILRIFDTLFEFTRKNEKFMRLYWMVDSDEFEGEIPDELIHHVSENTKRMFKNVVEVVKKAQKNGQVVDVDPTLLAHLMSAINKGIFIHASKERRFDIANISPNKLFDLLKMLLRGGLYRGPGKGPEGGK
jgi:TetR/AcrR family fatty acid metabolism transcriptional regulator